MELTIKCPHDADPKLRYTIPIPRLPDYHPLAKEALRKLLEVAAAHHTGSPKRARRLGGRILRRANRRTWQLTSIIQVRLTQGIRGMTCPRPYRSEAAKRMHALDTLYVETLQSDPQKLPDMVERFYELMEGN